MDVSLFSSDSHVIIKTQNVDPRAEGGARILIKESSRDESSLEKSSTDTCKCVTSPHGEKKKIIRVVFSKFSLDL